jgi:cyclic beta-1,2-glucan synthetase
MPQAPLRAEIFGAQRFAQHGRSLGLTHRARSARWTAPSFFPRLRGNIEMLRTAHLAIAAQSAVGQELSPASLWLLDNFHLIEAQLLAIHEGLPRSYFRALPVLVDEPLAGLPRVYGVAWAFVAHTDSAFDEELLVQFLCAYQETRELGLAEMWALPTTLRVVLVENLRRLAERLATQKAVRELANLCCDRIAACTVAVLQEWLVQAEQRGAGPAFLLQMAQRLHDRTTGAGSAAMAAHRAAAPGRGTGASGRGPDGRQLERQQCRPVAARHRRCRLGRHRRAQQHADAADAAGAAVRRRTPRQPRCHAARHREAGAAQQAQRAAGGAGAAGTGAHARGR